MKAVFFACAVIFLMGMTTGDLVINDPAGVYDNKNAPYYHFGSSNFNITNATLIQTASGIKCTDDLPVAGDNNTVLMVVTPLCYPEDLAIKAQKNNFAALIVANGIAPATGLWAVNFWKSKANTVNIPVIDIRINLATSGYKNIKVVSFDSTSTNYFTTYAKSGGFIFLLVLAHLSTFVQFVLALHRMRFQWFHGAGGKHQKPGVRSQYLSKLSNVATLITVFHCLGAVFRHLLLGDPFGVYGNYNFPATNWLVFFATAFSEVATFLLGFSLHRIIAQLEEEFHGGNVRHELRMMIGLSVFVVIINIVMTLLNNIAGLPDSFFIVLNLFGVLQVYVFWYFFQNRAKVLQQETHTASATNGRKGFREYQMQRSMQLLQSGLIVITLYVVLFQPISLAVLKFGKCQGGFGDCSALLAVMVLAVIVMNISAILQLMSLPGETKAQWEERMGGGVKSDDHVSGNMTAGFGQSSQVVELEDVDMGPSSVGASATAGTQTRNQGD
jgi:hypothetical protein